MSTKPGEPAGAVGVPDAFDRLFTPHRMDYIQGENKPENTGRCPFCDIPSLPDQEGLVVARGKRVYAVLNLYPYNAGHLLLVPNRHVPDYTDLEDAEAAELGAFTRQALQVVRRVSAPHGFNIGMNLGRVAGAGIAEHVHQHVVPRWGGDSNFMPIVGRTRVLPQLLGDTRKLLADAWDGA